MTVRFSGDKLRAARHASGLTQAELARRAHVRERQIIRWENAQHSPRTGSVMVLARVLKVTPSSLMESGEDDGEDDDAEIDSFVVPVRIDYDLLAAAIMRRQRPRAASAEGA